VSIPSSQTTPTLIPIPTPTIIPRTPILGVITPKEVKYGDVIFLLGTILPKEVIFGNVILTQEAKLQVS